MIVPAFSPTKSLIGIVGIVALGVLVALGTVLALTFIGPVKAGFAIGGLVLLIPALVVRDPRGYGLFLLVFSIVIEVYIHTTKWLVDPLDLFYRYGLPGLGTLGLDIYVTDLVFIAMLLPWLAQLARRQSSVYFPKIGYIFVLYLIWALIVSLFEAKSFYLSIFEWFREILYFSFFLYVINNVVTRAQLRAVLLALFVGLVMESGVVIAFFELGIGTETKVFSGVVGGPQDPGTTLPAAESGGGRLVARSAGTFAHPAYTAFYLGYILPIVLAYLTTVRRARERILYGAVLAAGCVAFCVTFSRAGIVGLLGSIVLFFPVAAWSRLISRQTFVCLVFVGALLGALMTPLLIDYLESRPEAANFRLKLIDAALVTYWQHPIVGVGLNNSSAATEGSHAMVLTGKGSRVYLVTVVHNYYLIVLIEVGIIGFLLFFGFFWQTAMTAFRHMRAAEREMKLLLVGIVSALAGTAIHNLADPFSGHSGFAMLWLYVGLIFAICRRVQAKPALPASANNISGLKITL
jgi:O-antigen ligase